MHPAGGDAGLIDETPILTHGLSRSERVSLRARLAAVGRDACESADCTVLTQVSQGPSARLAPQRGIDGGPEKALRIDGVPRVRKARRAIWSASKIVALFSVAALVGGCGGLSEAGSATTTPASISFPSPEPPTATPTPAFDLVAAQTTNAASEVANRRAWAAAYAEATAGEPVAAAADTRDTRTAVSIAYVIDGDTVVTSSGDSVRIIGIDSPEHGLCGFTEATEYATQQLLDQAVTLIATTAEPDGDKYGRLLRYIELQDGSDFGLLQIQQGNAAARFDGYDGYSAHPRQETYHQADDAVMHRCADENPARTGVVVAAVPEPEAAGPAPLVEVPAPASTDPWNLPGTDLDCKDIGKMVHVDPPDYHKLDKDGDGWGCESYG